MVEQLGYIALGILVGVAGVILVGIATFVKGMNW